MAKELDQAERRRYLVMLDDFTPPRSWESTLDIVSQGPCAPINPKGWVDPLSTPQEVLKTSVRVDKDTGRLTLMLRDGYALWRDDLKQKAVDYDRRLYNDAMMLFGTEGPEAYEEKKPALLNYTGPGPQAWQPVEAALQGNSAALGRKPLASDPRIAKYFAKPEEEHVSLADLPEEEHLQDLEEAADAQALGGKIVKVGPPKAKKPMKALQEA